MVPHSPQCKVHPSQRHSPVKPNYCPILEGSDVYQLVAWCIAIIMNMNIMNK